MLNVLEVTGETVPATIASFFEKIGETVTGMLTGAVSVFNGLWSSGAPGQLVCSIGFASMVIGIGFSIFRIKKGRKR